MSIRVRIAPSPTGPIHVGNVHTALFNWLWARKTGGQFVLRFEDTDQERSRPEWEEVIFEDLKWLGLTWDEGPDINGPHEPYRQMARLDLYQEYIEQLLETGHVYRCYDTSEELEAEKATAEAQKVQYKYSRRCLNLTAEQIAQFEAEGRKPVIRFKVPDNETVAYDDLVRGRIEFPTNSIGDFIIMRANGIPLYNFAVVIDDATMGITHIVRGEGHIPNTPVQLLIYRALGLTPPEIGHIGHMTNADRGKLSKRNGDAAIRDYREQGYLPEALVNFMALLGWTPPGAEKGEEILSVDQLIAAFDIKSVTKASSVWDRKKLDWMNAQYLRKKTLEEFAELALPFIVKAGLITEDCARNRWSWFCSVVKLAQERVSTLAEVPDLLAYFFDDLCDIDDNALKLLTDMSPFLHTIYEAFDLVVWTPAAIESAVRGIVTALDLNTKQALQALRAAVTGRTVSPGLFETIALLGRVVTRLRLGRAMV